MGGIFSRRTGNFDPKKDLLSLEGKVVLVTGGNSGIGYQTVKLLARRGAKVYLGARNETNALDAIKRLEADGIGSGQVIWHKVDFGQGDPRMAKEAAEKFITIESRLDILINNGGMLVGPYKINADGISEVMAINHFCTFTFTRTLLPLLTKTAQEPNSDVRVITVASIAHSQPRASNPDIHFHTLEDFNHEFPDDFWPDSARYSITKLAQVLFARELQRQLDVSSIPIVSIPLHPGEVDTGGFAEKTPFPILAGIFIGLFGMAPEPGAYNSCFAAAAPVIAEHPEEWKGVYLEPVGKRGDISKNGQNDDLAKELWDTTERILNDMGI